MVCSQCNASNADGADSCKACGASLIVSAGTQLLGSKGVAAVAGGAEVRVGSADTMSPADIDAASDSGNTTFAVADAMIGTELGSYRLLEVLGEGGMGRVYLAEHTKIGRKVALKMLHSHLSSSPEVIRRFFAEARAVNKILHENIVEITDFIESNDGDNYFIMEHLRGQPLSKLIENDGQLSLSRSIGIAVQICSALRAVHEAGIVHRDLKPENVFITERGGQKDFVKLLDFGIAKLMDQGAEGVPLQKTAAGVIMGTPEYMSPEQANGKPVDKRTDIYSLGIILYELTTGQLPFKAETFGEMCMLHTTKEPLPPSRVPDLFQDIPRPLEELILHCLKKDPDERPQSVKEIEERLRAIAATYAVQLEHFDVSSRMGTGSKRLLIGALGAAVTCVVIYGALAMGSSDKPAPSNEPASVAARAEPAPAAIPSDPPAETPTTDMVELRFSSTPAGAQVYRAGQEEPIGTTPFVAKLERAQQAGSFTFKKEGFSDLEYSVSLSKPGAVSVDLSPAEPEEPAHARSRPKRRHHRAGKKTATKKRTTKKKRSESYKEGAVMDPFAD